MGKSSATAPTTSAYALVGSAHLAEQLASHLPENGYSHVCLSDCSEFLSTVQARKHTIDCLIFQRSDELPVIFQELHMAATLLPAIILETTEPDTVDSLENLQLNERSRSRDSTVTVAATSSCQVLSADTQQATCHRLYHRAEVHLKAQSIQHLPAALSQAINRFILLTKPTSESTDASSSNHKTSAGSLQDPAYNRVLQNGLNTGQRLSAKLNERLGYLGVFYKRSAARFYKNLSTEAQQALLQELQSIYHEIINDYFSDSALINERIDMFVNLVFFADLPITKVIEIHMNWMDKLEKQLKIEGHDAEFLLSYRLALIDTMAHLCEMYRRALARQRV